MRIIIAFLCVLCSFPLSAQLMPSYKMTKDYSLRQLEEWLKTNVRPRFTSPADFNLSFQINTGWKYVHDKLGSVSQVGFGQRNPANGYNVGLTIDYTYSYGRGRAVTRTVFRNKGGLFRGTTNSFSLARGYLAYNVTTHGPFVLELNLGRRTQQKVYNSQIQFSGHADGASYISSYLFDKIVDLRALGGIYISNNRAYYIFRGMLFNIANLGFYFDYVYTHWGAVRPNGTDFTNGINLKFNTSQFLFGWDYKPQWINRDLKFFVALVRNHGVKSPTFLSHGSRENMAGYVGGQFGNAKKQNDFSIQIMFQYVGLQAIPPWNMSGIGTGSAPASIFTATSSAQANTNTNFKGWEGKILYSITDDLTINAKLQRSVNLNKAIGQPFNFTNFGLETQYIF